MFVTVSRLCQGDSSYGDLVQIRVEQDDLRDKLLVLEGEKHSFEECYDLLVGEKASLEDKVIALDGSVEGFSQHIEVLVEEKKAFEDHVDRANKQWGGGGSEEEERGG